MGRFCGDFRWYRSALSVSGDTLRSLSPILASRLCIQKFRSPRQGFRRPDPGRLLGILGVWRPKTTFRTRSTIIVDSIQGLRTVGSILPERHEVARLQYRAAND